VPIALRTVVDAPGGMTMFADKTGHSHETLYSTLSERGDPRLDTLAVILPAFGLLLTVRPAEKSCARRSEPLLRPEAEIASVDLVFGVAGKYGKSCPVDSETTRSNSAVIAIRCQFEFGSPLIACDLSNGSRSCHSYRRLERCRWRRRKGSYVWRSVLRLWVAIYRLPSAPILANTSCTALIGAPSSSTSSVPLPP
jgi:hypothetical protein